MSRFLSAAFLVACASAQIIPNEYICVTQTLAHGSVAGDAAFLARAHRDNLVPHTSWSIGGTFRAHFFKGANETHFETLSAYTETVSCEPNGEVWASQTNEVQFNPPSWGLQRVWQRDLPFATPAQYQYSATGEGVDIYVADTGIYLEHNDFQGRAKWGLTVAGVDGGDADCNGHGTHCAGTAAGSTYGIAKKASLIAVKVLGCGGGGSWDGIISAFQWITDQVAVTKKPSIVSLSLGGGVNSAVNNAINSMTNTGVHNSVAAGNNNYALACNYSPAGASSAFTVASAMSNDSPSSFSNVGACVNVWAPGSSITSAWIGNPDAKNTISGTSMACPHVTGTMALILEAGNLDPKDLAFAINNTATPGKIIYGTNANLRTTINMNLYTNPHPTQH